MQIKHKRSNVVELGAAKAPTSGQLEYGELAVNYSNVDPVIFLRTSTDEIVRIAGADSIGSAGSNLVAGDGISETDNGDETFTWAVEAQAGYGIAVEASGLRIGDDWSNIPALT